MKTTKNLGMIIIIAALNTARLPTLTLGVASLSNPNGSQWSGYGVNADRGDGWQIFNGNTRGYYGVKELSDALLPSQARVAAKSLSRVSPRTSLNIFWLALF